jgi:hypothetical protein
MASGTFMINLRVMPALQPHIPRRVATITAGHTSRPTTLPGPCDLTNTTPGGPARQLADLELRHRRHARVEDRIRNGKDTGLANLPFHDAAQNRIWLTKHSWKQVMHSPLETAGSIIIGRCHSRCVLLAV